jgi:CheY-like chemotaxis protein
MREVQVLLVAGDADTLAALERAVGGRAGVKVEAVDGAQAALASLDAPAEGALFRRAPLVIVDGGDPQAAPETVAAIKDDDARRRAPTIVLAGPAEADRAFYRAHANAVVERPEGVEDRTRCLERVLDFWLSVPALP